LHQHAIEYIRTSDNVENLRGKGHIQRVSVERVCAGPAVPLIYDFYRKQERFKDYDAPLEKDKPFNDLKAKDIIQQGMNYDQNGDELCF